MVVREESKSGAGSVADSKTRSPLKRQGAK